MLGLQRARRGQLLGVMSMPTGRAPRRASHAET